MNIKKINEAGSSYQFKISGASYQDIVDVLGEPNIQDDPYKVDASWHVEDVDSGRRLAIWNYKNGPAYLGDKVSIDDINSWSASGSKSLAKELGLV